jgi:hypothetical protein
MQKESDEEGDPVPVPVPATHSQVSAVAGAAQMILSLAEVYLLLSPATFRGETSAALAVVGLIRAALHLASSMQEVRKDI